MPSKSKAQQQAMAIASHAPGKLYARNTGLLKMSQPQLQDFASTPRAGLPQKVAMPRVTKPHIDRGHSNIVNPKTHAAKLRSS